MSNTTTETGQNGQGRETFLVEGEPVVALQGRDLADRLDAIDKALREYDAMEPGDDVTRARQATLELRDAITAMSGAPSQDAAEAQAAAVRRMHRLRRDPVAIKVDGREVIARPATDEKLDAMREQMETLRTKYPDAYAVSGELTLERDQAVLDFMENPSQYRWDRAAELHGRYLREAKPSGLIEKARFKLVRAGYKHALGIGR